MVSSLHSRQKGLTLIELMIAVVLGLLLVTGVIKIFTGNNQTYRVTEAHSRLQDNARFALDILSKDVRSAGFSGCRPVGKIEIISIANAPMPVLMEPDNIIGGNEFTDPGWTPNLLGALGAVVAGTDVITMQHAVSCGATLTSGMDNADGPIPVFSNSCGIKINDPLMISDCTHAHIFRATDVSTASGIEHSLANLVLDPKIIGNSTVNFCTTNASDAAGNCLTDKKYNYDSEVYKFASTSYFIRLSTAGGGPSLWKFDHGRAVAGGVNPIEIIEGIENMQIVYGLDTNDDDTVDNYQTANMINNAQWEQVVSARISLLAQTIENNLTTSDQNVIYNGQSVTGDGKLRRVFTSTISIRNRVQ